MGLWDKKAPKSQMRPGLGKPLFTLTQIKTSFLNKARFELTTWLWLILQIKQTIFLFFTSKLSYDLISINYLFYI